MGVFVYMLFEGLMQDVRVCLSCYGQTGVKYPDTKAFWYCFCCKLIYFL